MKTTKNKIVVLALFLLAHLSIYAQYSGGNSDGNSYDIVSVTSCPTPTHFYAYFGGSSDGTSSETIATTTCGFSNHFYAYFGGSGDGSSVEELTQASCGTPAHFYAYFGGENDGASSETLNATTCGFPPQFYAYFGGQEDGFSMDATAPICPTQPPVANFTASQTNICVGQSVTFTDTSTNIPFVWAWTFPGGTPNSSTQQNPTVLYNTPGTYAVTLVASNYNGNDTKTVTSYITVTAIPTVSSTTPASRCDAGTVTLSATATSGTLSWYANATGGTVLGTGTSYTTPSINTTTTYYVESASGTCASPRVAVIATVNTTPTITSTTPAYRCGTGSVTLNATSSAGSTVWYTVATGGTPIATTNNYATPSISATTTYYVEATTGSCTSPRTAVIATINAIPTITSTVSSTRCDSGTLTLSAVASSGTLNWFTAATGGTSVGTGANYTTPSISTTTTYYVEATNGSCTSPRTAVVATVNTTPTVTPTANSRCGTGTITLTASTTSGTLSWYANATGGTALGSGTSFTTPSISTTTTYYVEAVNGTCTSPRVAVVATINVSPSITSSVPATICSGDGFTISVVATSGTVSWYANATGGTVLGTGSSYSLSSLSATTTFYAEASTGTCQSARTPIAVTVNQRPINTSVSGGIRCGTGTVVLNAVYNVGTINWYTSATGGTIVGTGSSFTTPSLSTSTTYYVEAVNGSCISLVRTPVTATINAIPTVSSTTPASRCGTGSVTLNASSTLGTLSWYSVATGGTVLGTGTSFTTPSISATTTYYVEATNGSCTSSRTAVIATIDAMQSIISTTPSSRCNPGTLTLNASATGGTLNWYAFATGGSILATGSSFVTPSITTTTTYYVEVTNGSCVSSRTAVTATIQPVSAPTGNVNQTFCAGETVGLLVASGTSIVWYNTASGGSVVPNSTPLVSGTTYYASQNNGSCESPTRLAVTATLGACLGNESFAFDAIKLYPNPVLDILNISNTEAISKVEVVDMLGRVLVSKTINDTEAKIDMSNMPNGTYLIQVQIDDKFKTFKIIRK